MFIPLLVPFVALLNFIVVVVVAGVVVVVVLVVVVVGGLTSDRCWEILDMLFHILISLKSVSQDTIRKLFSQYFTYHIM